MGLIYDMLFAKGGMDVMNHKNIIRDGSTFLRSDGRWAAVLQSKRGENNGKPKYFYGKSESEVKQKLDKYKEDLIKHDYRVVAKTDVASYLNDWLTGELSLSLKPKSYDIKEYIINNLIVPNIGCISVGELTRGDVQKLIKKLVDSDYSYSTIKKVYDTLNQRFKRAVLDREVLYNPVLGVTLPKTSEIPVSDIRFFSADELSKIIELATSKHPTGTPVYRLGYEFQLMAYTGMRAGEVLALTWDDIDFDKGHISINKNSVRIKERDSDGNVTGSKTIIQDSAKTRSGNRIIPMSIKARAALDELKKINGGFKYVLSTKSGKMMSHRELAKTFAWVQKRAGVEPPGSLHSLRHTFASRLIEKGTDIKVVSELLGHSDISITYNTYVHIIKEQKVKAISTLDEI